MFINESEIIKMSCVRVYSRKIVRKNEKFNIQRESIKVTKLLSSDKIEIFARNYLGKLFFINKSEIQYSLNNLK